MHDPALLAALIASIRATAQIPADLPIQAESRLIEDLQIDSLDLVSVYLNVQDRFGVVIDEADLPALGRVGDLARYIAERQTAEAA